MPLLLSTKPTRSTARAGRGKFEKRYAGGEGTFLEKAFPLPLHPSPSKNSTKKKRGLPCVKEGSTVGDGRIVVSSDPRRFLPVDNEALRQVNSPHYASFIISFF